MTDNIISYISGGFLGDFFSQLSIIKENFMNTGKKGLLYITDIKQNFRNPLDIVYKDTYDIIMLQEYIFDYKIYNNEPYEIDLSSWRHSPLLNHANFYDIYTSHYGVEWGKNKWLNVPFDEKWKNIVLINIVPYKFNNYINYDKLKLLYPDFKFVFISIDKTYFDFFKLHTNQDDMEFYCPTSLLDTAIAINSCKFLIASTSALLCVAYSCHKKSMTTISSHPPENTYHGNLGNIVNTTYI